jgi:hypothetical protein
VTTPGKRFAVIITQLIRLDPIPHFSYPLTQVAVREQGDPTLGTMGIIIRLPMSMQVATRSAILLARLLAIFTLFTTGCSPIQLVSPLPLSVILFRGDLAPLIPGKAASGPSHDRTWRPEQAILPYADLWEDRVVVHHVRDARYRSSSDYDVRHRDIEFHWEEIEGVDFLLSPFPNNSWLAHTMLSFRRRNGNPLAVSIEARLEQHEQYHPWSGVRRRYELMYVLAEETDVIPLRTEVRKAEVLLYPSRATPEQARTMLQDILLRVNQIARTPEWYDTLSNNCTTNLVLHVESILPARVPWSPGMTLTGLSARTAYRRGWLACAGNFEQTRELARINDLVPPALNSENFSAAIRVRQQSLILGAPPPPPPAPPTPPAPGQIGL